jgi:uncharacterized protein YciI
MFTIRNRVVQAALAGLLIAPLALAQAPQASIKPQQYVYVLRLVPALHDKAQWTGKTMAITAEHFSRLKQATDSGKVILAGRTNEELDKTFGLVIFEADSPAAAKAFMEEDPAVKGGLMTATLHPYAIALQRKQ